MRMPGDQASDHENLVDRKAALRRHMLSARSDLTAADTQRAAMALAEHTASHPLLTSLDPGPIIVPTRHRTEIDTTPLAHHLEAHGWTIIRPRTHPTDPDLDLVGWPTHEPLSAGRWGVPEPPQDAPTTDVRAIAAVLVPGVAFDPAGNRLGMGSGIFDRFLDTLRHAKPDPAPAIGIGYVQQLVPRVPTGDLDQRLDGLQLEGRSLVTGAAVAP